VGAGDLVNLHSGISDQALNNMICTTAAAHDGTLSFSAGAASYKSSTTESSGMEGTEEDTISCKAASSSAGHANSSKGED
jgi:hypothetical protein